MCKLFVCLFCIIFPLHAGSQTIQNLVVKYDTSLLSSSEIAYSNKPITWNDFQGKPEKNVSNVAITYSGIKMRYEIKKTNNKVSATILLCPYMDISASWYKKEGHNDYILAHEQLHFDIVGIIAQQLFEAFLNSKFKVSIFQQEVKKLHQEYVDKLYKIQQQYDDETNHGINKSEQLFWNQKISEEIKKYSHKTN